MHFNKGGLWEEYVLAEKGVCYQQGWVTDANKVGGWWEELGVRPKPTPTKMGGLLTKKAALIGKVGFGRKGVGYQQGRVTDANKVGGLWEEYVLAEKACVINKGGLQTQIKLVGGGRNWVCVLNPPLRMVCRWFGKRD